jgi:hypothetical protein
MHALPFIRTLTHILNSTHPLHSQPALTRLAKALFGWLVPFLASHRTDPGTDVTRSGTGRKGKKRSRGYEGDEVFKLSKEVLFNRKDEGECVLLVLNCASVLLILQSFKYTDVKSRYPPTTRKPTYGSVNALPRFTHPSLTFTFPPSDVACLSLHRPTSAWPNTQQGTRDLCGVRCCW